jgi:hypothetical protein
MAETKTFKPVKSPNGVTAMTNFAYFAPGTFASEVKYVKVVFTSEYGKITESIFNVGESSKVLKGSISLNNLSTNYFFNIENHNSRKVLEVTPLTEEVTVAKCINLTIVDSLYSDDIMKRLKTNKALFTEQTITKLNNLVFNEGQNIYIELILPDNGHRAFRVASLIDSAYVSHQYARIDSTTVVNLCLS